VVIQSRDTMLSDDQIETGRSDEQRDHRGSFVIRTRPTEGRTPQAGDGRQYYPAAHAAVVCKGKSIRCRNALEPPANLSLVSEISDITSSLSTY
jgi:hypothetical protein